jgi:hypothetical protein
VVISVTRRRIGGGCTADARARVATSRQLFFDMTIVSSFVRGCTSVILARLTPLLESLSKPSGNVIRVVAFTVIFSRITLTLTLSLVIVVTRTVNQGRYRVRVPVRVFVNFGLSIGYGHLEKWWRTVIFVFRRSIDRRFDVGLQGVSFLDETLLPSPNSFFYHAPPWLRHFRDFRETGP